MDFSVKIEGLDKLARNSQVIQARVKDEVEKALYVSGKKVEGDAKKSILDGQKSGRTYKRRTVFHRASAPGEAPASDTGRLVNSINSELIRGSLEAVVKAGGGVVKYARMLEFGTSKMAARPFFFRSLEQNKAWIAERMQEAMRKALK